MEVRWRIRREDREGKNVHLARVEKIGREDKGEVRRRVIKREGEKDVEGKGKWM